MRDWLALNVECFRRYTCTESRGSGVKGVSFRIIFAANLSQKFLGLKPVGVHLLIVAVRR